jgi:acetyl-CoA acetyltransferase family protein
MKKLAREIWILGAKRTPFGALSGALKGISATDLGVIASKAALEQSKVKREDVSQVFAGNVVQTSSDAAYLARHIGLKTGLPIETPALTVNRLCGSGFQTVVNAAEQILLGEARCVLAVGTENMTQAPHVIRGLRDGVRYGAPPPLEDSLQAGLTDAFIKSPMGITAENLGEKYGITREACDGFALRSQARWAAAQEASVFADELAPVSLESRKGAILFDKDEHPRPSSDQASLAKLKPVFKQGGLVTAANASGICDGAGALVVADAEWARAQGLTPLAKLRQWCVSGVQPEIMGIGPVPAIRGALERAGLKQDEVDFFDVNEAFAAQFLAVQQELGLPEERTNVNGGAIALGHPLGASGSRISANLIYQLRRSGKDLAVGAACIGGGQGIAVVFERA